MNQNSIRIRKHQEQILYLIKFLNRKDSLNVPEMKIKENHSIDKENTVIPFNRIR